MNKSGFSGISQVLRELVLDPGPLPDLKISFQDSSVSCAHSILRETDMSSAFFLTWPCALHFPRPAPVCHLLCVQSAKAGQKLTVFAVPWFLYALPWNINRIINCSWEPSYPATVFTHSRKENSRCVANNAFSHTPISSCNNCHVLCYMYILEGG